MGIELALMVVHNTYRILKGEHAKLNALEMVIQVYNRSYTPIPLGDDKVVAVKSPGPICLGNNQNSTLFQELRYLLKQNAQLFLKNNQLVNSIEPQRGASELEHIACGDCVRQR